MKRTDSRARKTSPRIVLPEPIRKRRQPNSGNRLMYLVGVTLVLTAVALSFVPDRSEPFKAQSTHREHSKPETPSQKAITSGFTREETRELEALIDRSPTRAERVKAEKLLTLFADDGKPVKFKFGHWKKGM